jgi:hypothetical protein
MMKTKLFLFTVIFAAFIVACNQSKKSNKKEPEAITEQVQEAEELKPVVANGVLLNAENDEPIGMAMVIVAGTRAGTMTGPDGKFQIEAPAGAKQIAFSANGFEGQKVDIDAEKQMVVKLKPKTE